MWQRNIVVVVGGIPHRSCSPSTKQRLLVNAKWNCHELQILTVLRTIPLGFTDLIVEASQFLCSDLRTLVGISFQLTLLLLQGPYLFWDKLVPVQVSSFILSTRIP